MKKKINFIVIGVALIFSLLCCLLNFFSQRKFTKVSISNKTIKAEVADNLAKRTVGLSEREELKEKEGMLFIFDKEGHYGFWMLNMKFPIDIVWISKNKTIVGFVENAKPCTYNCTVYKPNKPILYALEVRSGFCKKYNVRSGQKVFFNI